MVWSEHRGVRQVTWVAGASSPPVYYNQLREQDNNPAYARGVVQLDDAATAKALEARLQDQLIERFQDAQIVVKAFGQGPPIFAPIGFRITGPDPDRLRILGEKLREVLHRQPAVTHTRSSILGGEAKLWLAADEQQAQLAGLTLADRADQFQSALDGRVGGRVLEDLEDLPVRIRYAEDNRGSVDEVSPLQLNVPGSDTWIPAATLGEIELRPEMQGITRRNGERVNEIHGFLRQGALPTEITHAVLQELANSAIELPPGYRIDLAGDSAEQQQAIGQLLTFVPVIVTFDDQCTGAVISLVRAGRADRRSRGVVGRIGYVVAVVGRVPAGLQSDHRQCRSDRCCDQRQHRRTGRDPRQSTDPCRRDRAIVDETVGAIRHIVSTTLTTMAGFMPLLLFTGGDFWPPLAIVIAGEVGLSGILSLLLTPAAYRMIQRAACKNRYRRDPADEGLRIST